MISLGSIKIKKSTFFKIENLEKLLKGAIDKQDEIRADNQKFIDQLNN